MGAQTEQNTGAAFVLPPQLAYKSVDIANAGTDSTQIDLGIYRLTHLYIPAAFTGTSVSFKISYDGTNWFPLYDAVGNVLYTVSVTQDRVYKLSPVDWIGVRWVQVISNAAEGGARTLVLGVSP